MEYLKIPLEDIELSSESGTEQVLILRRARGGGEFPGQIPKIELVSRGVQTADAVWFLFKVLRDRILEQGAEIAELRARLEGKRPAKRKAAA